MGDTDIKLVTEGMFEWFMTYYADTQKEFQSGKSGLYEPVPEDIVSEFETYYASDEYLGDVDFEGDVHVTSGSYQNDKALEAIPALIDGQWARFFSLSEMQLFLRNHPEIEVSDEEYSGVLY